MVLTDTSPPLVSYSVNGIDGNNNWYRGNTGGNFIVVHWAVSDPESPIISTSGCEPAIQINGPVHQSGSATPLFAWRAAKRARYYNVQPWLQGRRVGSWWPARARLKLRPRWRMDGEPQRLAPGSYTWYVSPGRGARRHGRYGPLLGRSTFVVG